MTRGEEPVEPIGVGDIGLAMTGEVNIEDDDVFDPEDSLTEKPKKKVERAKKIYNPHKTKYSAEFRASVLGRLHSNEGNVHKTAVETGIPGTTIGRWATESARTGFVLTEAIKVKTQSMAEHFEKKRQDVAIEKLGLAEAFERVAMRCLRRLVGKKLNQATALELIRGAGICADKSQLLKGEATTISGMAGAIQMTPDQLQGRLTQLYTKVAELVENKETRKVIVSKLDDMKKEQSEIIEGTIEANTRETVE